MRHRPTRNGNGKNPADRYLGGSLPLFGSDVLSYRLAKMPAIINEKSKVRPKSANRSNDDDHPEGDDGVDVGDEQSTNQYEDHYEHALPVFGVTGLSHEPANGNGKTTDSATDSAEGQLEDDHDLGHSLPLFGL